MSDFILPFSKVDKNSVDKTGGKGASLGEMTKAGFPVPPGFVILANAFDYFVNESPKAKVAETEIEIAAQLEKINFDDPNSIDKASNVIRDIIHDTKIPKEIAAVIRKSFAELNTKFVAVRSSATAEDSDVASWAGELETYLDTTEDDLLLNVKKCWSSLYTPRALFYRYEKKLSDQKVLVAVVVQGMIESEISGISFTVHPVTKDYNQMIIESGWGLGEAIVSGQITPDSYIVDKTDFSLLDVNVAEQEKMIVRSKDKKSGTDWIELPADKKTKQKLTGEQIVELAKICKEIEDHYEKPQDIEWAYASGKFYITQSRPITTL